MLCEKCQKNEANVSVNMMINGVSKSYHLCSECAEKQNIFQNHFEGNLLNNFLGKTIFSFPFDSANDFLTTRQKESKKCTFCGQTLEDFKKTGLFGCPQCYQEFRDVIEPILDEIHGSHWYTKEKINSVEEDKSNLNKNEMIEQNPKSDLQQSYEAELKKKKEQLKFFVQKEDYEQAAKLRDEIKAFTLETFENQQEEEE